MKTQYLYIHIPFCKEICSYCDFERIKISNSDSRIDKYIDMVINQLHKECELKQFKTIYLGGGTPNMLSNDQLEKLLSELNKYINTSKHYEFTIECNPEFVNKEQVSIFKKNGINRVSLGVQSTNNKILKQIERNHTIEDAQNAINVLYEVGIENVSCDFIYALENITEQDIADSIQFIVYNNIKHVSYYALEVKPGSKLAKQGFIVDEEVEADNLEYINEFLEINGYKRYEVSNWALDEKYESMHNKAYWLTEDWKAIGYSASGFENKVMYKYEGDILNCKINKHKLTTAELYLQVLMMGLRLVKGIDVINNKRNSEAYATYFDDIVSCYIRDGHLRVKNLNLLHETLVNIVDETKEKQLENVKNKVYEEDEEEW